MVPKMFEPLKYDCTSVISYVAFVLSLFGPHLSFFGASGVGEGVGVGLRDCGISWLSSLIV